MESAMKHCGGSADRPAVIGLLLALARVLISLTPLSMPC